MEKEYYCKNFEHDINADDKECSVGWVRKDRSHLPTDGKCRTCPYCVKKTKGA